MQIFRILKRASFKMYFFFLNASNRKPSKGRHRTLRTPRWIALLYCDHKVTVLPFLKLSKKKKNNNDTFYNSLFLMTKYQSFFIKITKYIFQQKIKKYICKNKNYQQNERKNIFQCFCCNIILHA